MVVLSKFLKFFLNSRDILDSYFGTFITTEFNSMSKWTCFSFEFKKKTQLI